MTTFTTTLIAHLPNSAINFSFVKILNAWAQKSKTRSQLKHLSQQQLNDIGLTKSQALKESQRPFWK